MGELLIQIIPALIGWLGGDSARFTTADVSSILGVHIQEVEQEVDLLVDRRILEYKENKLSVTNWGSLVIDYSLLSIVSRWAFESSIYSETPYHTLQWLYARHVPVPSRKLPYGLKGSYVFDFCQDFMHELTSLIPRYSIADYSTLRNFTIRLSLHPTYQFLSTNGIALKELMQTLQEHKIIKIQISKTSGAFVVLDSFKLEGFLARFKRARKGDTADSEHSTR